MFKRRFVRGIGVVALIALLSSVLLGLLAAATAKAAPPPLKLEAKSAILLDHATGQVLYEQDADTPIPPASLTKLMTIHLALKKIESGAMKLDDKVEIRPEAWAAKMPGSSVMFLEPGQNVTVGEILKGIAIPSGNDAAIAIAQHMAGTVDAFVEMMNKEARDLGFDKLTFVDPAGLSPKNLVTARQFAQFSRKYIEMHPQALTNLHSVKEFTYPLPANKPKNTSAVTQYNRNLLLWSYEGTDGLKTGFIDESGYNIALTARRGDTRLVAVILGVPGANEAQGSRNREQAGIALLQWGFQNFATVKPPAPDVKPVRVWKGAVNEVKLETDRPLIITVQKGLEGKLTPTVQQEEQVIAPVRKGDKLGTVVYAAEGQEIARFDLVAAEDVQPGGFFKRIWDSIRLWVAGLFKKK